MLINILKAADAMAEALRAFSKMADAYDPFEDDDFELCWDRRPNLGELRRARAELAAYEAAKREEGERPQAALEDEARLRFSRLAERQMDARDDVMERLRTAAIAEGCGWNTEAAAAYLNDPRNRTLPWVQEEFAVLDAALSALRPGDELPGGMVVVPAAFVQAVRDYQSGDYNGGPHKPTDECDHGVPYYGICEVCIDQHFEAALAMLAAAKEGKDG